MDAWGRATVMMESRIRENVSHFLYTEMCEYVRQSEREREMRFEIGKLLYSIGYVILSIIVGCPEACVGSDYKH